jgi:hypothetical protein
MLKYRFNCNWLGIFEIICILEKQQQITIRKGVKNKEFNKGGKKCQCNYKKVKNGLDNPVHLTLQTITKI